MNMDKTTPYADLLQTFAEAGLPVPPIPSDIRPRLAYLEPWCWATYDIDPGALYVFGSDYLAAVSEEAVVEDHVGICHVGHGLNSYGLHYLLMRGPLRVITQFAWGGVYMDAAEVGSDIAESFLRIRDLLRIIDWRREAGQMIDAYPRITLAYSSFRGVAHYQVSQALGDGFDLTDWVRCGGRAELFEAADRAVRQELVPEYPW